MNTKLVQDLMTKNPITVTGNTTLPEAYWVMLKNNIHQLPVLEYEKVVGIVTLEDLRRMDPISVAGFHLIRVSDMLAKLPVRQVMTPNPKIISPQAPLVEAAKLLLEYDIRALPVVENERLVGIISVQDILRTIVENEEGESENA
ncbi:MAG: CBS domain-containing protein [Anaerolineales bacterium]|nr:CBS domain-containing protein [Anaerolineales bacterium]